MLGVDGSGCEDGVGGIIHPPVGAIGVFGSGCDVGVGGSIPPPVGSVLLAFLASNQAVSITCHNGLSFFFSPRSGSVRAIVFIG